MGAIVGAVAIKDDAKLAERVRQIVQDMRAEETAWREEEAQREAERLERKQREELKARKEHD